jgi:hypothetical protein
MLLLADWRTKKGDRIGDRPIKAMTPVAADKLYALIAGGRPRQGEKLIALCRRTWNVVHRLHPDSLIDVPNPWLGVTKKRRVVATKPAATREEVYAFAEAGDRRWKARGCWRVFAAARERACRLCAVVRLPQPGGT